MKRISIVLFLCVWAVLSSWAQTYKYEEIYTNLPFAMPKVEAPRFPDLKVSLPDFGAVGNGVELCTEAFEKAIVSRRRTLDCAGRYLADRSYCAEK